MGEKQLVMPGVTVLENLINMNELTGWATIRGEGIDGISGGGNAIPQIVTNLEELKTLAKGNTPRVIVVSGNIACGDDPIDLGSNKTIVGINKYATIRGGINLEGVCNVIVSNLNCRGSWPDSGPVDCIAARYSHHLWFNHLNIWNADDGNMDLTRGSDYITVSWCKFWYSDIAHKHRLCNLVGSGTDHEDTDIGKLKVTYHHNWFANLVDQRMPRILYGKGHVYNNYYTSVGNTYCIGVGCYASVLIENNYFKDVNNPHQFMYTDTFPAHITTRKNIYDNTKGNKDNGLGGEECGYVRPFVQPPYEYDLDDALKILKIVPENAGPQGEQRNILNYSKIGKVLVDYIPKVSQISICDTLGMKDNLITYDDEIDTYLYHGQNIDGSNASFEILNPFREMNFYETPYSPGYPDWKKGVTITYDVKLPIDAIDAAILNFNLINNRQINCFDKVKYEFCKAYSSKDDDYSLGDVEIYLDINGKEYTVLRGHGSKVQYNPDYPMSGCYSLDEINGNILVYPKGTNVNNKENWTYVKYIGSGLYEDYGKRFDEVGGKNSKISEANISGSLSIYASGTVGFRQDNLTGLQLNPNLDDYGYVTPIQVYNKFCYWGNGGIHTLSDSPKLTPTMEKKNQWHFVVVVIQNDWIQFYMDGKEIDKDYLNWRNRKVERKYVAGRTFNLGNRKKESSVDTNINSMTLLDFISNKDTKLTVGGTGSGAVKLGQYEIGTPNGVQVKNITFYNEPIGYKYIKKMEY